MARQNKTPMNFQRSVRVDQTVTMSSGRAGVVFPCAYIPLLRGDSASGRIGLDFELAELPKPLLNSAQVNVQAWFVPKAAFPQFTGYDEFMASYQGLPLKALGQADRNPPEFYRMVAFGDQHNAVRSSEFWQTLGLPFQNQGRAMNTDLVDAFNLVYNFRLAAHSSKLERKPYVGEGPVEDALELPAAFWPSNRFSRVVPDYERALVVGALDLDVEAGDVQLTGNAIVNMSEGSTAPYLENSVGLRISNSAPLYSMPNGAIDPHEYPDGIPGGYIRRNEGPFDNNVRLRINPNGSLVADLDTGNASATMAGETITTSLAQFDKSRLTQAFAKYRATLAGNDATGFDNDEILVAEMMQGFHVPEDQFKRPWLLDQQRVTFGMIERHATDGANLDQSVSQGRASVMLNCMVPANESGGYIIVTAEVLPERIYERQEDPVLFISSPSQLPDALRDIQRPEPVDVVLNRRLDVAHTTPNSIYGYEPMNDQWNREFTRLGGVFYKQAPSTEWTENRSSIWQPNMVDPTFTDQHFLAPVPFPHDVFSDTEAPAFEFVARHDFAIVGLTQIGDVLLENNDDYEEVAP